MTNLARRLRLAWLVSWILGFGFGEWIVVQTPWAGTLNRLGWGWKFIAVLVAYVILMLLINLVWRSPADSERRPVIREFVDAAILGALIGLTVAR